MELVHAHDSRRGPAEQRARDQALALVSLRAHGNQVRIVAQHFSLALANANLAIGHQDRRIDVVDIFVQEAFEEPFYDGGPYGAHVEFFYVAEDLDHEFFHGAGRILRLETAEVLGQFQIWLEFLENLGIDRGKVDGGRHGLAIERAHDLVGHLACHVDLRLFRRSAKVRGNDNRIDLEQRTVKRRLGFENIQRRPRYLSSRQSLMQGGLVHNSAARAVYDPRLGLHHRELVRGDKIPCLVAEWHVNGYEIRVLHNRVKIDRLDVQRPGPVR